MWFLVLVVVAIVLLGASMFVGVPSFLQWLAKENIFVTTVKEGAVKAIMRGDSLDHFIISFAGYHLSDQRKMQCTDCQEWEVLYHGKWKDEEYDDRWWLLKKFGLYWVGWPWVNSVYVYGFEWNETHTDKNGKEQVLPRAEATDFIYVADFTYTFLTEEAETKDRLPTDERTLVTIAIRNPYRALFSGENWMRRVTAAINRYARNFVGSKNFQQLISPKGKEGWKEFSSQIISLNEDLPDDDRAKGKPPFGTKDRYGVEIRTADLQTIELSGDVKTRDQEATTKVYVAAQEAKAIKLTGQAQADVIQMKGDKEAEALEARLAVIEKHPSGEMLAQLDAMREAGGAGSRIIWANNPFIPKGGGNQ
jgi:hypothetical protein